MSTILQKLNSVFQSIKTFAKRILNFIPTKLPIGVTEAEAWASDIIKTYGFPDNDSFRFSLFTMIMHLASTEAYKAKRYFALALHKAAANQVAAHMFQEIKTRQQAAVQAAATPVPATVVSTVVASGPQQ